MFRTEQQRERASRDAAKGLCRSKGRETQPETSERVGLCLEFGVFGELRHGTGKSGMLHAGQITAQCDAVFPVTAWLRRRVVSRQYMDKGELVPDELVVDLIMDRFKEADCANGYVLDGFPRTIPQAEALDKALAANGEKVDFAINVEVPDENIINRMSGRRACVGCGATYHIKYNPTKVEGICDACGEKLILRDDDKPETVKNRLSVYHEQTQPLIDYYAKKNVLAEVDGTKDMEDVFNDIVTILGK